MVAPLDSRPRRGNENVAHPSTRGRLVYVAATREFPHACNPRADSYVPRTPKPPYVLRTSVPLTQRHLAEETALLPH